MIIVNDRSSETAAGRGCGIERVFDQFGAQVISDRPADQRREKQSITVAKHKNSPSSQGR